MPLVIPAGYGQAAIELRADGDPDPWYVTFGVDLSDSGGDNAAAAQHCLGCFQDTFTSKIADFTSITACDLAVGVSGAPPLRVRFEDPAQGLETNQHLPQNCALLVHKQTARGGRRGRGRMFVPGILKDDKVNGLGQVDGSERTALQSIADAFLGELAGAGPALGPDTPMVLLHNDGGVSPAGDPDPVMSLFVDGIIATQRGRLRR